jgi:hypothetical protein
MIVDKICMIESKKLGKLSLCGNPYTVDKLGGPQYFHTENHSFA